MLHQNDNTESWPEPTYSQVTNVRVLMQNINRDISNYNAKFAQKKVDDKKAAKDAKDIREMSRIQNTIGFPFMMNTKNEASVLLPSANSSVGKISLKKSSSLQPRNYVKYSHKFKYNHCFESGKSSDQLPFFQIAHYKNLKMKAFKANIDRKIFTVYGNYVTIRKALVERGWIEKIESGYLRNLQSMTQQELLKVAMDGNDYEKVSLSKFAQSYPTYFIWQSKEQRDDYSSVRPFRNRIRRSNGMDFTTKVGLIGCTEKIHWHTIDGVAEVKYPRFFSLNTDIEKKEFLSDYRVTQAISLLNFITSLKDLHDLFDPVNGIIELKWITFAIASIENAMKSDDTATDNADTVNTNEKDKWRQFITNSLKIINKEAKFRADSVDFLDAHKRCKMTITSAKKFFKTLHMDGYKNMWIVKPGYQRRGTGIYIFTDYDNIMAFINKYPRSRYVVQKYIERPLLIYNTKFDIRQYILITFTDKINIWLYKECYLKFSSQEFTLQDFRESIHLTNHTVQRKYVNGKRSAKLPRHNMWNLFQFQQYLKEIGKADAWDTISYPGIKRIVTGIVLTSLEETEITKNAFEMYGCDFMLDEHFNPVLIEINATPDMTPSTIVTAKICPAALDDLVKVVVDIPKDSNAGTGSFELIYQVDIAITTRNADSISANGMQIKIHKDIETPVFIVEHSQQNKLPFQKKPQIQNILPKSPSVLFNGKYSIRSGIQTSSSSNSNSSTYKFSNPKKTLSFEQKEKKSPLVVRKQKPLRSRNRSQNQTQKATSQKVQQKSQRKN